MAKWWNRNVRPARAFGGSGGGHEAIESERPLPAAFGAMRRQLHDDLRAFSGTCGRDCDAHPKPAGLFTRKLGKASR